MDYEKKPRGVGPLGAMIALAVLAIACAPALAQASEPITSFTVAPSTTQAGAHPDLSASFALEEPGVTEVAKSATVGLPAGLTLFPSAVTKCTASSFALDECPIDSQVGLVTINADHEGDSDDLLGTAPVFALVPAEGGYGELGFIVPVLNSPVSAPLSLRAAAGYGLRAAIGALPQAAPLAGISLTVWGVPSSPSHDGDRFDRGSPGEPAGCPGLATTGCIAVPAVSNLPELGFTLNPTVCGTHPLSATLDLETYGDPGHPTHAQASLPATTDCDLLSFNPSFSAVLTTAESDSASGLDLELNDPLFMSPNVPTPSELRSAALALPPEMELNTTALSSYGTCTDAEAELGRDEPGTCPNGAKVGTVSLELGSGVVSGYAYLGEPGPGNSTRLLLLVGEGTGAELKLTSELEANPQTGQVSLVIDELPQLPISELNLHLFGGLGGLFVTPLYCEAYEVEATFTPWDKELSEQLERLSFEISSGPHASPCLGPAEEIEVALAPEVVVANGSSHTTVTATVADANGTAVPGDEITFSSTDHGQLFGPVIDHGDGTYSAQIVASTTPGTSTITATDESVVPLLSGSAQLTETADPNRIAPTSPAPPAPPAPIPEVTLTKEPPRASRDRRPTFRFESDVPGASFSCELDQRGFRPCASPFTLPRLAPGRHSFQVRAANTAGAGTPVDYGFTVMRPRRR